MIEGVCVHVKEKQFYQFPFCTLAFLLLGAFMKTYIAESDRVRIFVVNMIVVLFQVLSDNKLGTVGATCFCRMLSVNAGLRKLDLSGDVYSFVIQSCKSFHFVLFVCHFFFFSIPFSAALQPYFCWKDHSFHSLKFPSHFFGLS